MDTKTLCLAALSMGDASGYEIKKMFEEGPFSHFYDAGYGSIYPALNGLLGAGHVTCEEMPQEGRPAKKVYSLTPAGKTALCEALHTRPAPDRVRSDSLVMLYFAELLTSAHRDEVLEEYLEHHKARLETLHEMDLTDADEGRRFVHGLGVALYGAAVEYLETHGPAFASHDKDEHEHEDEAA